MLLPTATTHPTTSRPRTPSSPQTRSPSSLAPPAPSSPLRSSPASPLASSPDSPLLSSLISLETSTPQEGGHHALSRLLAGFRPKALSLTTGDPPDPPSLAIRYSTTAKRWSTRLATSVQNVRLLPESSSAPADDAQVATPATNPSTPPSPVVSAGTSIRNLMLGLSSTLLGTTVRRIDRDLSRISDRPPRPPAFPDPSLPSSIKPGMTFIPSPLTRQDGPSLPHPQQFHRHDPLLPLLPVSLVRGPTSQPPLAAAHVRLLTGLGMDLHLHWFSNRVIRGLAADSVGIVMAPAKPWAFCS